PLIVTRNLVLRETRSIRRPKPAPYAYFARVVDFDQRHQLAARVAGARQRAGVRAREREALAVAQALDVRVGQGQFGQAAQPGFERQQQTIQCLRVAIGGDSFQTFQCVHRRIAEGFDPQPPQRNQVCAATQAFAEIAGQAAHIGAGAAFHVQIENIAVTTFEFQLVDFDFARRHDNVLAAPRALVQRHTALLDRRIRRGNLHDAAAQTRECSFDRRIVDFWNGPRLDDFAFGIIRRRGCAEPAARRIGLARAKQVSRNFRRFAEADRQQTGGQRIEAAGMSGLVGVEEAFCLLQRAVGAYSCGFIEEQDAADGTPGGLHFSPRSSASIRSPRSTESSYLKRNSGTRRTRIVFDNCMRNSLASSFSAFTPACASSGTSAVTNTVATSKSLVTCTSDTLIDGSAWLRTASCTCAPTRRRNSAERRSERVKECEGITRFSRPRCARSTRSGRPA